MRTAEPASLLAAEHERLRLGTHEVIEVFSKDRQEVGRDGDLTLPSFCLRRPGDDAAADELVLGLGHVHDGSGKVESLAPEREQLTEAKAAVGGEQRTVAPADRIGEGIDLPDCGSGALRAALNPAGTDIARILREHPVGHRSPEHSTQ